MKRSILVLALLAVLFPGCGEQNLQSPFLVRVSDINDGFPTQADVIIIVEEGPPVITAIPEDVVTIRVTNKPYSPSLITAPSTFWHDFQLTSYTVTWRSADSRTPSSGPGWTLSDFDFEAGTSEIIPINSTIEIGMLLVPAEMKAIQPFINGRVGAYYKLIATIEFVGHPVTDPTNEYRFQASTSVNIADFADE